ncbi:quinon protein alcohol dehydrogenase-like superfamily [Aspergillus keveii]|uniref:Quinon protein alcohol dehydrogenase-like superfamily n=1 Tax=Aspergillus keveii TaxID=714993 RepID=A0ABR4G6W5_9EURO
MPSLSHPAHWEDGRLRESDWSTATSHTPLHAAARNGHHSLVQLLLGMNANPSPQYHRPGTKNSVDFTWATPLFDAARIGHLEVVRSLLEAAADPNEPCGWVAPLHIAAQNGYTEIVHLFLESGKVLMDATSLFKAAVRGDISVLALQTLTVKREIYPPVAIEVGTIQSESHKTASEWYAFFNPQVHKALEVDLLRDLEFERSISCITFSGDGKYIAVCTDDTVGVFDAVTGQQIGGVEIAMRNGAYLPIQNLCFSPGGSHLAGSIGHTNLWLWDISTSISSDFHISHITISAVLYTPDGHSVVTGSFVIGDDASTINLWDVSGDGQPMHIHTLELENKVRSLTISPDGRYLVIGSGTGDIMLWDIRIRPASTATLKLSPKSRGNIWDLSLSFGGCYLVCHGYDGIDSLEWISGSLPNDQPRLGELTIALSREVLEGNIYHLVTADEHWLLSRQPIGKIIIQDTTNGEVHAVLQAHTGKVCSLICSSAGHTFATASDHQVRVWKIRKI